MPLTIRLNVYPGLLNASLKADQIVFQPTNKELNVVYLVYLRLCGGAARHDGTNRRAFRLAGQPA
jgi:hypothetical protein